MAGLAAGIAAFSGQTVLTVDFIPLFPRQSFAR